MKSKNFSHQRELLIQCLTKNNTHLTVDEIFDELKKVKANISLATIYRNLAQLEKEGGISKIHISNNSARYEINKGPHHHFICKSCGEIKDLETPQVKSCNNCISDQNDFTVDAIISTIIGQCSRCNRSKPSHQNPSKVAEPNVTT